MGGGGTGCQNGRIKYKERGRSDSFDNYALVYTYINSEKTMYYSAKNYCYSVILLFCVILQVNWTKIKVKNG